MTSIKQFRREENIIIPSKNFITTLLNISEDMLEECIVRHDDKTNTLIYDVKLKKMTECCPYCGGDIVGYGYVHKKIKHPALRQFNGEISLNIPVWRSHNIQSIRTILSDNNSHRPAN